MSTVRIPPVLRANVGGAKQVDIAGATVGEIIEGLVGSYPALRGQLLTEDGQLNRFVNVYLNDQDVRYLEERATPVGERDTIIILPAMAGGCGGVSPASPLSAAGRARWCSEPRRAPLAMPRFRPSRAAATPAINGIEHARAQSCVR